MATKNSRASQSCDYDVAIIGGGITGTATLYVLSRYTNVQRIVLLEKYPSLAQVNSHKDNNSQTLHYGDIETNYTLDKATKVKHAAAMTARYIEQHKQEHLFTKSNKMVLAVGDAEAAELEKRHDEFKTLFPELKKIGKKEIARIEPNLVKGRDPSTKLLALLSPNGYAVDYGRLSESFAQHAAVPGKTIDILLGTCVHTIKKMDGFYAITDGKTTRTAKAIVVAAGPQSLTFAYKLGYGKDWILLPVAGNFFAAPRLVHGKVYMMQLKKLPFAAIHADPDVSNPNEIRFGPVAKVIPMLERRHYRSFIDFMLLFELRLDAIVSLFKILADPVYVKYLLKQVLYDLPLIGRLAFLREARKIVPRMTFRQLKCRKMVGGIRPQIVDVKKRAMLFGEAKIIGHHVIFDITPSPGASVCLKNAEDNTKKVLEFLGKNYVFDEVGFKKDLG